MTSEYKGITNDQAAFAALGVFDGVHTGHRAVIEKVKEEAAMRNLSSAVISFRTHPQQVLHPEIPFRMLTSPEERAELLRKTGIDRTIFLDFTPEMSLLSAYDFLKILSNRYCIKGLIREDLDPHLAATLDVTSHGDTGSLDLSRGDPGRLQSNKAVLALAHHVAAGSLAGHAAALDAAVLNTLRQ
jgi:hypothetical protein